MPETQDATALRSDLLVVAWEPYQETEALEDWRRQEKPMRPTGLMLAAAALAARAEPQVELEPQAALIQSPDSVTAAAAAVKALQAQAVQAEQQFAAVAAAAVGLERLLKARVALAALASCESVPCASANYPPLNRETLL